MRALSEAFAAAVVVAALLACNGSHSAAEQERVRVAEAERRREQAAQAEKLATEANAKRIEGEHVAAARLAGEISLLKQKGPAARAAALTNCMVSISACPGGAGDPSGILDAAATPAERKRLEATLSRTKQQATAREAVRERQEARASAPLLCCDGSNSPT